MNPCSLRHWMACGGVAAAGLVLGWWGAGFFLDGGGASPDAAGSGPAPPPRLAGQSTDPLAASLAGIWAAGDPSAQTAAAVNWARSLAPSDFRRALEAVDRLPAHTAQDMAKRAILRRWAAADPAAALHWSVGHDPELVGTVAAECIRTDPSLVESVFTALSAADPAALGKNGNLVVDAVSQMFNVLATRDREAAMDLLTRSELPAWESRFFALRPALRALAGQDPAWMLERAESLPASDRADVRASVAQALVDSDPVQAIEWARHQPDSRELLKSLLVQPKDMPSLIAGLATLPAADQAFVAKSGVTSWGKVDAKLILDALEAQAPHLSPAAMKGLLRGSIPSLLAAADPGVLANRLLALGIDTEGFSVSNFASTWARQSPDASRAWATALTDETWRASALEAIEEATRPPAEHPVLAPVEEILQDAATGELSAPRELLALDPADRRRVLDVSLERELALLRSRALAEKNQPDEGTDPFATHEPVLRQIGQRFPSETARWLSDTLSPESTPVLMPALTTTAAHWAMEEPRAAAAWTQSLPPGDARAWAAFNVYEHWRQFDETASQHWWESLPAEERAITSRHNNPENP